MKTPERPGGDLPGKKSNNKSSKKVFESWVWKLKIHFKNILKNKKK